MSRTSLPPGFAELEPLVAEWSLGTQKSRAEKRIDTEMARLKAFHGALRPRIEDIIGYMNTLPNDPGALAPDAKRLYHLAQMFMEAAAPIDLAWPTGDIEDTFPMERFEFLMD
jgi:hypothetical protein